MGQAIGRCLSSVPDLKLVGAVDLWDCPALGKELGEPDEAEVGPRQDVSEPFSAFEVQAEGFHARLQLTGRS